jgi:hypothetical protein
MKVFFGGFMRISFLVAFCLMFVGLQAEELLLRDNMMKAKASDFLVIQSNKTQTLLHIADKRDHLLTVEEIAVPEGKKPENLSWKDWISRNAPGNTSWVIYDIDLRNGQMSRYFSFTKNNWYEIPDTDNFLSKLLNLRLMKMPESARKKVGPKPISGPDWRPLWQPRMIIDGKTINGVAFDAWETKWPRDNSELSGKTIEIYLPKESDRYRAYFPYWLQINGAIGKAKVRIIDSGMNLKSPKSRPSSNENSEFGIRNSEK